MPLRQPDNQPDRKTFLVQPFFEEGGGWDAWGLYPGEEREVEATSQEAAITAYLGDGPLTGVLDWKVKEL